jgi:hypothetical protein
MIAPSTADALAKIERIASDLREAFAPGTSSGDRSFAATPALRASADPLSVVAPPAAYFLTGSAAAPQFTRDGCFVVGDGELRTGSGAAVLGFAPGSSALSPIRIDPVDAALGRPRSVRIEADGSVAYLCSAIDPRSGERREERVVAGRLALARFPAGTSPRRIDAAHSAAPEGVAPHVGAPGDGAFAPVTCYSRDCGSIDLDAGLMRLQEAYLQLGAVGAAGKALGGVEKTALDLLK